MERETKTITTPSGHKIILHTYATGREVREIEGKYLSSVKVDVTKGEPTFKDFDTSAPFEAEKAMLKVLVISVDDKKENIIDTLLDLPSTDYEFIVSECNEITKKKI